MKLLGLNSPEIFIILVVFLLILGTKRIENGFLLFKKLLKFLLSKEEIIEAEVKSKENLNQKNSSIFKYSRRTLVHHKI